MCGALCVRPRWCGPKLIAMGGEENVVVAYYCQQYAMEKMLELRNKVLLASRRVSGAFPHYDISFLAHSA